MIKLSTLHRVPNQSELHSWADYMELLCIADVDNSFSITRMLETFDRASDLGETDQDAQDGDPHDVQQLLISLETQADLDPLIVLAEDSEMQEEEEWAEVLSDEDLASLPIGRDIENRDKLDRWGFNLFALIVERARALGDLYPFNVDHRRRALSRKEIEPERSTYLFLLIASSLRYVDDRSEATLTKSFERLCSEVMAIMLPSPFEVRIFGTAADDPTQGSSKPFEKVKELAASLNAEVVVKKSDFHRNSSGDNGLDLVAWLPMGDAQKGVPAFYAQCACGSDWEGKQYESSYLRWKEYIRTPSSPINLLFIPRYFRGAGSSWYVDSWISGVLVDRLRILRFLKGIDPENLPADGLRETWEGRRTETN